MSMGSIIVRLISKPEFIIALGIFVLFCIIIFLGMKRKSRRRGLPITTNASVITMGGLNKEWSDIDSFDDEDIPGAAGFVTPTLTAGN